MDVSGTGLRKVTCPPFSQNVPSRGVVPSVSMRPRTVMMGGFSDERHLQYYDEKKKKGTAALISTKKKMKMLKGLLDGLSMFPEYGVALDPAKQALFDDLQGKLTLDAAGVLMKQLEQLRAEEKEMKRKKKQEKKAKLKASKKMNTAPDCESSSSSSSESSDCECDEVFDMNTMRASVDVAPSTTTAPELRPPALNVATMLSPPALLPKTDVTELFSRIDTRVSSIKNESAVVITAPAQKRIEVCMGNKCKKSGAAALLQEFEKVVGVEGAAAVVSCMCMGNCKSAPNVRIQNPVDSIAQGLNDSVKVPTNPLFIGVGLEDVEAIVARFLGEENQGDTGI